jgi:ABC-type lipoprotein release transport system permease subunit
VLALELGAFGCCALAVVALAASLAALWRRRRSETVILRAIGFAPNTQAATRGAEIALAVAYAVVCGVLAGIVVTLVAGNALARRSVPGAPQALPVVGAFDVIWLIGCLVALLVVLALVILRYTRALYRSAVRAVPGRTTT